MTQTGKRIACEDLIEMLDIEVLSEAAGTFAQAPEFAGSPD